MADLGAALDRPARPLFIGRKPCLPTAPLSLGLASAVDAVAALDEALARCADARRPAARGEDAGIRIEIDARLAGDADVAGMETDRLVDRRDWRNQMHTAERAVYRLEPGQGRAR
jgi:CRISPR system Cascade subunit CasD